MVLQIEGALNLGDQREVRSWSGRDVREPEANSGLLFGQGILESGCGLHDVLTREEME
jgi:hypothetical protein